MEPYCQNRTPGTNGIPRRPGKELAADSDDGQQGNNLVTVECESVPVQCSSRNKYFQD